MQLVANKVIGSLSGLTFVLFRKCFREIFIFWCCSYSVIGLPDIICSEGTLFPSESNV